jgi:hypothetical protein
MGIVPTATRSSISLFPLLIRLQGSQVLIPPGTLCDIRSRPQSDRATWDARAMDIPQFLEEPF